MMLTRKGLFGRTVTECGIAALSVAYPDQMQGFLGCDRVLILREGAITGAPNGSFFIDVSAMEAASQDTRVSGNTGRKAQTRGGRGVGGISCGQQRRASKRRACYSQHRRP